MHGEMVRMWNLQCRYCSGFYCKAGNAIHIRGAVRTVQQDGEHEMMFKTSYNGKKVSEWKSGKENYSGDQGWEGFRYATIIIIAWHLISGFLCEKWSMHDLAYLVCKLTFYKLLSFTRWFLYYVPRECGRRLNWLFPIQELQTTLSLCVLLCLKVSSLTWDRLCWFYIYVLHMIRFNFSSNSVEEKLDFGSLFRRWIAIWQGVHAYCLWIGRGRKDMYQNIYNVKTVF